MHARQMQHGGHSFVGRGLYACQLRPWLRMFNPDQLLVVTLEQLNTAPANREVLQLTMAAIQMHVGLACESIEDPAPQNQRARAAVAAGTASSGACNATRLRPTASTTTTGDASVIQQLVSYYRPHNRDLCSLMEKVWMSRGAGKRDDILQRVRQAAVDVVRGW